MFRSRLEQILDHSHPLYKLGDEIDWTYFEQEFGVLYVENMGRPGIAIRVMVGLHYLKHAYNESDESVVARFLENPYWQYFCGFEYFQHTLPVDPTGLVKWRKRIGPKGIEKLLRSTIETARKKNQITEHHLARVNIDTTVQEKAVAFPTDARLYHTARKTLVREAKRRGIKLRQSYERLSKKALFKQGRHRHSRRMKQAEREKRKLRVYLGRVIRNVYRECKHIDGILKGVLVQAERIFRQQRGDTDKVYSVHAPEVECIAKGKAHKKYEFGCKVAMASTSKDNWIVGIDAIHGNPYDGHTLKQSLGQIKRIAGTEPKHAYCDAGYRGDAIKTITETTIHLTNRKKKSMTVWEWMWCKRRAAIEPIFGHLKSGNRLDRNHLKGKDGDRINAILAGCGFNLRKLIRAILIFVFGGDDKVMGEIDTGNEICLSPMC